MKIPALSDALNLLNIVRERRDGGFSGQQHSGQQKKDQPKPEDDPAEAREPVSREQVQSALESFVADTQTQANGISADLIGNGPGLRVVLKDGAGQVLRQYSGDEFLRLRETTRLYGRARGKILDQKF